MIRKYRLCLILLFGLSFSLIAQEKTVQISERIDSLTLHSLINPLWSKWQLQSYNFGLDISKVPIPVVVDAPLSVEGMIMVRGTNTDSKRWGYHCFEAYAQDDKSRFTMLLNKHEELGKPVAELYYFANAYTIADNGYNWVRIGSDVRRHSFLFSRDRAVFYGGLRLNSAFVLANLGKEDIAFEKPRGGNGEENCEEESRFVNYTVLKEGGDGTMFYDKDHHMIVVKVNGKWMRLKVESLPKGVSYPF